MKLHQLRALLAISENGSIQEASRLLGISQPALSKSIKELETELGVSLLVRSNRGITITGYGERLVRSARLAVEEVQRAQDEIDTLKGSIGGRVAIGVSPVTPSRQFADCVQAYRKRHPEVQLQIVELRPAKLLEGVREGQLDMALTSQPMPQELDGLHWQQLYTHVTTLAVRKGHPLSGARSLHQLLDQEWLLSDPLELTQARELFREHQVEPPQRIIECDSVVLYVELAGSTDAVSFWSRRMFNLPVVSDSLMPLEIAESTPRSGISLVSRPTELLTREARSLFDDLVEAFREAPL
ncbi:LysR substrate-binding domain-containing protein [Pseudomonas knackmussii]|uniref:LysR substrate-binding domain-containing protein n=1 Tax=Pseudomonas knackmussii TaxID=65741 RepID=UPI003BDFFB77